ncbi:hypothetical protein AVEN_250037-1 [Araneus ventricosus]|uniref:DAGKc domain-containing protein n=1 Tax=Araneus ventricosus TaxID=182803 RepID=A0A4Y2J480_ARAVE|nr:hypothetical protein AVEN_250037-1 [Araneus ventricosus]
MNIIEDIRDALLHAVENRSRTPMDLWTVLKDEWCELPPRYLQTKKSEENMFQIPSDFLQLGSNFSLQQLCHKFVMTRVQSCREFVMTRVQACSKLTKASKSPWNELAASLPQACRANSLQIIAETKYEHYPG